MKIDLHMHSHFSDGEFPPEELVDKCGALGLDFMAITDHECVMAIPLALSKAKASAIRVIPGVELQAEYAGHECHFLGYFIDCQSPALKAYLDNSYKLEIERAAKMVEKLKELGFIISLTDVFAQAKGVIAPYHIGRAILTNAQNNEIRKGLGVANPRDFFFQYITRGGKAHIPRPKPPAKEVIGLIKKLNGLAFWGHPAWDTAELRQISDMARTFKSFGLDGLEVFYPLHENAMVLGLHNLVQELKLLETGGSDFHSTRMIKHPLASFDDFGIKPDFSWLERRYSNGG